MTNAIPLTRAFVLLALARCFADAGGNPAAAFEAVDLPHPDDMTMDRVFPARAYYDLLEEMTARLDDQYFPARAGAAMARSGLPILIDARNRSHTLGEFLLRVIAIFRALVTNGHYELLSDGRRATLSLKRTSSAGLSTSRVDALNAGAFVTLLRAELANASPSGLSVSIPDPEYLPDDLVEASAKQGSREGGMVLSFPADWLLRQLQLRWRGQRAEMNLEPEEKGGSQSLDFVRERIRAQLAIGSVSLASVARDAGMSERRLQRMLKLRGMRFRDLVSQERLETVRLLVATTDDPLERIAHASGFSSQQALSRAFSAAYGEAPSAYRRRIGQSRPGASPEVSRMDTERVARTVQQ